MALGLSLQGASVVLVTDRAAGGTAAGRLAGQIRAQDGRVAVFTAEGGPGDTEALIELVTELSRTASSGDRPKDIT